MTRGIASPFWASSWGRVDALWWMARAVRGRKKRVHPLQEEEKRDRKTKKTPPSPASMELKKTEQIPLQRGQGGKRIRTVRGD